MSKGAIISVAQTFKGGSELFLSGLLQFCLLAIFEAFAITLSSYFFGDEGQGNAFILIHSLLSILIMFLAMTAVILIAARKLRWEEFAKFEMPRGFWTPAFFLFVASALYSLAFLLGLVALVVPGIFALVFFSYVPLMAVFYQSEEHGNFAMSIRFTKLALMPTVVLTLLSFFVEVGGMLFQNQYFSLQFLLLMALGLLTNYFQVLFVYLFHRLCSATELGQH